MFDGLYFEYPKAFTFIFIYIACEAYCKMRSRAIYFPHVQKLTNETTKLSTLMWLLKWFGIVFILLALMSPVRNEPIDLQPEKGPDTVFVVQSSLGMQEVGFDTTDVEVTRYKVVKEWISRWVKSNPLNSYALVVATEKSYIASPLSASSKAFQVVVQQLPVSNFKDAIDYADIQEQVLQTLAYGHTTNKIVVVIGDERIKQIQWDKLKREGIQRYTITIVSEDKRNMETVTPQQYKQYEVTTKKELENVYKTIDKKERLSREAYDYTFKKYYYFYPLFLAFFSLLLYVYLRNRRGNV